MMQFIETPLKGAWIIKPEVPYDHRGSFFRIFCKKEFKKIGHFKEFLQFNESINFKKGTLRGLHFQYPPFSEIKMVRCVKGAVLDFLVDLRKGSPTLFHHTSVELTEDNMLSVYIPDGFAHGFITLTDDVRLLYFHTEYYTPNAYAGVNFFDPKFNIRLEQNVEIISDKDKNFKFLDDQFEGLDVPL